MVLGAERAHKVAAGRRLDVGRRHDDAVLGGQLVEADRDAAHRLLEREQKLLQILLEARRDLGLRKRAPLRAERLRHLVDAGLRRRSAPLRRLPDPRDRRAQLLAQIRQPARVAGCLKTSSASPNARPPSGGQRGRASRAGAAAAVLRATRPAPNARVLRRGRVLHLLLGEFCGWLAGMSSVGDLVAVEFRRRRPPEPSTRL